MQNIILVGYGGHAVSVADTIERQKHYKIIGYTDSIKKDTQYQYLGTDAVLAKCFEEGISQAFICIGFLGKKNNASILYDKLKKIGYNLPPVVDPTAVIADSVKLEEGVFVGKNAVLNAESSIGKCSIINTAAIIEHECIIGDFTHIAVGAAICGGVRVGSNSLVGANATVIQGLTIGTNAVIGAGTTVIKDIDDESIYYGLRGI